MSKAGDRAVNFGSPTLEALEPRILLEASQGWTEPIGVAGAAAAATLQGQKWHDLDGDGVRDPGEDGLDG